jgi:hypothetical protein
MNDEIPTFEATLTRLWALFESVPEAMVDIKPQPEDWSVKQIACHLVDSASNNHQRFTRLQRTNRLELPPYEPEPWVAVEKPETIAWPILFTLLKSYNSFVLHLVRNLDPACLGHVWVVNNEQKSLEYLTRDYYRHLEWHIAHLEKRIREIRAM